MFFAIRIMTEFVSYHAYLCKVCFMATRYPDTMRKLISLFMRVHSVGKKTAERLAFNLLSHWDAKALLEFQELLSKLKQHLRVCRHCQCLIEDEVCPFCTKERLFGKSLCVVAQAKDAYLIESTEAHDGGYFVLGTLLSPLDGRGIQPDIGDKLLALVEKHEMKEVVLALDSSLEGDATAYYLRELLVDKHISVTKLASGMPMGAQLDFVDRGTLSEAIKGRQSF